MREMTKIGVLLPKIKKTRKRKRIMKTKSREKLKRKTEQGKSVCHPEIRYVSL